MNRRQFVAGMLGAAPALAADPAPDPAVTRVLVMFKCHLDVGFVDTQAAIVRKYYDLYFPQAIQLANSLRRNGEERYVWTTGSWLLYTYLEQADAAERGRMEQAIARGDIAWHALPFTWQSELLDPSTIAGGVAFSKALDRRFGRKTTGAKMTDVPGHTRGLVAPLAENGVTFLDIGVNSASTPPDVPPLFVWTDPSLARSRGTSIVVMYHRLEYGGVVRIPDSDLAVAVVMRDDNAGPHTVEEVRKTYADLKRQFPNAAVTPASLTEIADAVTPHRGAFPVLTQEIGDTWIYGVASDPAKLARFRELQRLRGEWLGNKKLKVGDKTDLAFLEKFLLGAEHTWGTDTKTWLDFDHYTPDALATMLDQPRYRTVTGSWVEKRKDLDDAVAVLPPALRTEAAGRLGALAPRKPDLAGLRSHEPSKPLEGAHFSIALDPATGAIAGFRGAKSRIDWASAANPLAAFSYQTLSKADYDKFLAAYITVQTDWAPKDFGKPGIERFGAQSRVFPTRLLECHAGGDARGQRLVARLSLESLADAWLEVRLPDAEPVAEVDVSWFGKRSNRMPEALWLTFNPAAPKPRNWRLHKTGGEISPFDVVSGGNRHMHALSDGVSYRDGSASLTIETLDAPLAVIGEKSPLAFSKTQPEPEKGMHFSLFNNAWGTNYVQWFGEDMRFRFRLR